MKFLDQEKRRQLLNERHSCKMFDSHYEFSSEELEEIAEIARLSPDYRQALTTRNHGVL
ncbi:hypothetical protein VN1156_10880 [Helicobacter pylori]|nr:hypothetical protein VN1156_10880 [Helicobacter pylori]